MTPQEEQIYEQGRQAAYHSLLIDILGEYYSHGIRPSTETLEIQLARLLSERMGAIVALRGLCDQVGDNDWTDTLHLADILEKHLGKYFLQDRPSTIAFLRGEPQANAVLGIAAAAHAWWVNNRPDDWDVQRHLTMPTINCLDKTESAIAHAVAHWVKIGGADVPKPD